MNEQYLTPAELSLWASTEDPRSRCYVVVPERHGEDLVTVSACAGDIRKGLKTDRVTFVCGHLSPYVDLWTASLGDWDIWVARLQ